MTKCAIINQTDKTEVQTVNSVLYFAVRGVLRLPGRAGDEVRQGNKSC
jgi:hypothetical protein